MTDLFEEKARDWDARPIPAQISAGVGEAIVRELRLSPEQTVLDFGAGTGLVSAKLAEHVGRILAVDISQAMLARLAEKLDLAGKVETVCQNLLEEPLGRDVDLVVSAMALHHVEDTRALLRVLFEHLVVGGQIALADLDTEEGDFHPSDVEGVFHAGFDRDSLGQLLVDVGFHAPRFVTACEVEKNGKHYPIFLVTATRGPDKYK